MIELREPFTPDSTWPHLGADLPISFHIWSSEETKVEYQQNRFVISEPSPSDTSVYKNLNDQTIASHRLYNIESATIQCYRNLAIPYLTEQVNKWVPMVECEYPKKITVRYQKTRLGSCGASGLNFNLMLMMFPSDLIDYVIVHELVHIRIRDHSPGFWEAVENLIPDLQDKKSRIKSEVKRWPFGWPSEGSRSRLFS